LTRTILLQAARDPSAASVVLGEDDWRHLLGLAMVAGGHALQHEEVVPPVDALLFTKALRRGLASLTGAARRAGINVRANLVLALLERGEGVVVTKREKA
jgi:hypothetical protein